MPGSLHRAVSSLSSTLPARRPVSSRSSRVCARDETRDQDRGDAQQHPLLSHQRLQGLPDGERYERTTGTGGGRRQDRGFSPAGASMQTFPSAGRN
eukprot:258941-Hanusia_phi.AAC.1